MGLQPTQGSALAIKIGQSRLDRLMQQGVSLDCKWESVDLMAVRVEGRGEACV